jgi:2-hydroxy-3-keto-5-methylthiopentenyl-1-phosphate phosphatase
MAIIRKNGKKEPSAKELFTKEEATFLISKLRQANYQGVEFETFYQIMSKLSKIAEKQ